MTNAKKRVLCVEDNPTNMLLISRVMEAENLELLVAEDGLEAESLLNSTIPDLILMDVNLPGINGLELTERIRANPDLPHIPIIAITANVLVGDREKCLAAGCDDYMPKPLDIRELRLMIRRFLTETVDEAF
jgi:two-component system cell cycle response regulator DivK